MNFFQLFLKSFRFAILKFVYFMMKLNNNINYFFEVAIVLGKGKVEGPFESFKLGNLLANSW